MNRSILIALAGGLLVAAAPLAPATAAELKVVQVQKTKDAVITFKNEKGTFSEGANRVVLEFTSPATGQPLDVGTVRFDTSMTMPGMSPMISGASLAKDAAPGRYAGTIRFDHGGAWRGTLEWNGPAGRGSTRFSVRVR